MKLRLFAALAACLLALCSVLLAADKPTEIHGGNGVTLPPPPPTEVKPVTEDFSGHEITDPYRWLEDGNSPETRAWIAAQMKYTEDYLSQVKIRPEIVKRLTELVRVERYSIPRQAGDDYFFTKRLPEENQPSIYVRKGLHGTDDRLVDATKLSADENTSVALADVAKDASLLVYVERVGGADEGSVRVLDVAKRQPLPDVLPSARYQGISLGPDNHTLYYAKYEPSGTLVFSHKLGTPASSDQQIFGGSFNGETFGPMQLISSEVTENGHYLLIDVAFGVPPKRVDVYVRDLRTPDCAHSRHHSRHR